jgi:hypothetical protein
VKQQHTATATSILTTKSMHRSLSAQRLSERSVQPAVAAYTVRSESRCALIKTHSSIERTTVSKNWIKQLCILQVLHFNRCLTLSLLMSYIYGAPCKVRNFNAVYIWNCVWQRWNPSLYIFCTIFQHWINAEIYPVTQLCVNTLPATKITLITDGI